MGQVALVVALVGMLALVPGSAVAQTGAQRPPAAAPGTAPPATPGPQPEIKLDETTSLKASALESRMAAIVANYALLQRQAQDLQQEMKTVLEERKKLIEEAARRGRVEVGDANEWAYENKGQRYVKIKRTP
ncbi:MAG TPA: hypothetical protein VLF19_11565 [Methylomirabilota bacterium]|nr:hypothetical protein [Methylomirabilota bacterium]